MSPDLEAVLQFAFGDVLFFLACVPLRRFVDKNRNGVIDLNELPNFGKDVSVSLGKGLYQYSLLSYFNAYVGSAVFAYSYGAMTVLFLENPIRSLVGDTYAWLVVCWGIYFSAMFMCSFSNNTIHVAADPITHFFYYGSAFAGVILVRGLPSWYLVLGTVLFKLALNLAMRLIVWPNYPSNEKIFPLFDSSSGTPVCISQPPGAIIEWKQFRNQHGVLRALQRTQIPFPNYELLGTTTCVNLAIGFLIAQMLACVTDNPTVAFQIAVPIIVVYIVADSLNPAGGLREVTTALGPKVIVISFLAVNAGCAMMVANRFHIVGSSHNLEICMFVMMHVSHFSLIVVGLMAFLAALKHLGCKACVRLVSKGNGNVFFEPVPQDQCPTFDYLMKVEPVPAALNAAQQALGASDSKLQGKLHKEFQSVLCGEDTV